MIVWWYFYAIFPSLYGYRTHIVLATLKQVCYYYLLLISKAYAINFMLDYNLPACIRVPCTRCMLMHLQHSETNSWNYASKAQHSWILGKKLTCSELIAADDWYLLMIDEQNLGSESTLC